MEFENVVNPVVVPVEKRQPSAKIKRNKLHVVAEQVVHAYTEIGKTISEIAEFFNCSDGTVRNLLLMRNVTMRARGRRKRQISLPLDGQE